MPADANAGILSGPWARCDRCGWDYRLSEMQMQNGELLCTAKCLDNPLLFYRQNIIVDVLDDPQQEMDNITGKKRAEDTSQWYGDYD